MSRGGRRGGIYRVMVLGCYKQKDVGLIQVAVVAFTKEANMTEAHVLCDVGADGKEPQVVKVSGVLYYGVHHNHIVVWRVKLQQLYIRGQVTLRQTTTDNSSISAFLRWRTRDR